MIETPLSTAHWSDLRARYLDALLAGDRRRALRLTLEDGLERGSVRDVTRELVQAAQREIGRLWEDNRIGIADEHLATAISSAVLAHLYDRAERGRELGKTIVVACVQGELHDLPARLVADALDLAGFDVRFLGANVPTDALLTALQRERPDLLALSVTMPFNVPALASAVGRLRRAASARMPILVGGGACAWTPTSLAALDIDGVADDAAHAVDLARRVLEVPA